jgi:hypothetical protein
MNEMPLTTPEKILITHMPLSHHQPEVLIQQYLWYKTPLSPSPVVEQERRGREERRLRTAGS